MICPNCKKENDTDARYCGFCGTNLQNVMSTASLKKRFPKVVWYSFTLFIGIVLFITLLHFRDPSLRFDTCLNIYNEGDLKAVEKNGRWGFVKYDGWWYPQKIDLIYEDVGHFYGGLAPVCLDGKWGFIYEDGSEFIPFQYDYARDFGEGMAPVCIDGKWGYIRNDATIVIPFKYEDALSFFEGVAAVKLNNKWGFIDFNDNVVIPFKYDDILWRYGAGFPFCVFAESGRGGTSIVLNGRTYYIEKKIKSNQIFYEEHLE